MFNTKSDDLKETSPSHEQKIHLGGNNSFLPTVVLASFIHYRKTMLLNLRFCQFSIPEISTKDAFNHSRNLRIQILVVFMALVQKNRVNKLHALLTLLFTIQSLFEYVSLASCFKDATSQSISLCHAESQESTP